MDDFNKQMTEAELKAAQEKREALRRGLKARGLLPDGDEAQGKTNDTLVRCYSSTIAVIDNRQS